MKDVYTSAEARETLQVDAKTFLRWLEQAHIQPHVSKADHRVKLFTREQIEQLAEEHERIVTTFEKLDREADAEAVTKEVTAVTFTERLEALEQRVSELERQLQERPLTTPRPSAVRPPHVPYATRSHSPGDTLPSELISYQSFARQHGIALSTAQKAIETGRLAAVRGEWKAGRAIVKTAIDGAGRQRFYELYSSNPHFTECSQCPHDTNP